MRTMAQFMTLVALLAAGTLHAQSTPSSPMWAAGQVVVDASEIGRIVGRVTHKNAEEPAQGAHIELLRPALSKGRVFPEPWVPTGTHAKSAVVARMPSGTDGSFRFDGVAPGSYVVRCATAPEGAGHAEVSLSPEEPVRSVILVFNQGRQAVGTVVDDRGEPLAQVFVYVSGIDRGDGLNSAGPGGSTSWTRSDRKGHFKLTQLPQGTLHLQAAHVEVGFSNVVPVLEGQPDAKIQFKIKVDRARFDPNRNPGGIGVSLRWTPAGPIISRVLPDKPAAGVGLLIGDLITAIDGRSTLFMSSVEFIARCRGPVGTPISLNVRRAQNSWDVRVERAQLSP